MAISSKESSFADAHLVSFQSKGSENLDLYELIEDFRQHLRLQQLHHSTKGETHSAFSNNSNVKSSFWGQQTPSRPCVCGDTHWFSDCLYLVPKKCSSGWNPNATKQKKVTEALQNSQTKAFVDRSLHKSKDQNSTTSSTSSSPTVPDSASSISKSANDTKAVTSTSTLATKDLGAFTVQISSSFSTMSYHLQESWILDNGPDSHICNSTMLSWFTRTHAAHSDDRLIASTQLSECYGTVQITISTPSDPQPMTLLNVAYISDFMTNIVSQDRLYSRGLYFDNWKMHLHRNGETVSFVKRHNRHYLLEDNTTRGTTPSASFSTTKSRLTKDWHQILGHASHDAIAHLETSVKGVRISDNDQVPRTNECETCALFKSCQIISRSVDNSESSTKPFHWVTYNLMQFTTAMNKDQWVSHFSCMSTDFNLVFTHPKKSNAVSIIQQAIGIIETRYNGKVLFF